MPIEALFLSLALAGVDCATSPDGHEGIPVTIGAYAPYATQPGLRLGVDLMLFERAPFRDDGCRRRNHALTLSPRVAVFSRLGNHSDVQAGAEVSWQTRPVNGRVTSSLGLGLSYQFRSQLTTETVELSTGNITREHESHSGAVAAVGYRFIYERRDRLGWYGGAQFGREFGLVDESLAFFSIEFGVQIRIGSQRSSE